MINVYNCLEDLACTSFWRFETELKSLVDEVVSGFIQGLDMEVEDHEWLSDKDLVIYVEGEEGEDETSSELELRELIDECYDEFIEEMEDMEGEDDDE